MQKSKTKDQSRVSVSEGLILIFDFPCLLSTVYSLLSTVYCLPSTVYRLLDRKTLFAVPAGFEDAFSGVKEGARNNSLARVVGGFVRINQTFKDALAFAIWVNSTFVPPLPVVEVQAVVKSIWGLHHGNSTVSSLQPLGYGVATAVLKQQDNNKTNGNQEEAKIHCFKSGVSPSYGVGGETETVKYPPDGIPQQWQPCRLNELPEPEPTQWLVEGYIAKGLKTELVGMWKAGKTTLIAEILRCMETGEGIFGRQVAKANALVITATKFPSPLKKGARGLFPLWWGKKTDTDTDTETVDGRR